jgi:pimeloyl-ACP methyl ester carboxylesterase
MVRGVAALNAIYRRPEAASLAVQARAAALDGISAPDPAATLARWFDSASPERDACEDWLRAADPAGYRDAYRVFAAADGPADATLAALPCPALFLTGAREPNSTPAMSRSMAALVPQGRAEIIEDAAHMMPMTHAAQVTAHLAHFAAGCP